ncbi:MAG TPA: DUF4833 domain-containing protein [Bacteroidota bacterium]|nr:DUF4833 domain-containing protein [Bacteroidota bacterium]
MVRMTVGLSIACGLAAHLVHSYSAIAGEPGERLFRITRNKNDNIVCYDVRQKNGKLDKDDPVSVYWIIPSEKNKREGLNFLERMKAYGVSIVKTFGHDSVDISLKAGKRPVRVTKRGGRWVALAMLDSLQVAVDSVYVMADESSTMPTVQWVEVMGHSPATGEPVRKRILK